MGEKEKVREKTIGMRGQCIQDPPSPVESTVRIYVHCSMTYFAYSVLVSFAEFEATASFERSC